MKSSIVAFLILILIFPLAAYPKEPTAVSGPNAARSISSEIPNEPVFHIVPFEKITDSPVQWVTAGGGVLAFGSGQQVYFSLEEDPSTILASLSLEHTVSEGLVLGRYAYLAQDRSGLRIFDLEDPSNPIDLGFYDLVGPSFHLASWGNFIFLGNDSDEVRILGISPFEQESFPIESYVILTDRGFIHIGKPVDAITVSADGKAYVATENEVRVYDVLDPLNPVEVDRFSIALRVRSMSVNGNILYAAAGDEGLHILDLSIPGKASSLATVQTSSESLYLAGRRAYLATGTNGLYPFQVGPDAPATFDIQATDSQFTPYMVHIYTGDTVNWIWADQRGSASAALFLSSDVNRDSGIDLTGALSHTFHTAGTFRYGCIPSCSVGGEGTVNVMEPLSGVDISVTPTSIDFGNISVGQSRDQTVTITNLPNSTRVLNGNVLDPAAPFSVVSGVGTFSLFPGDSKSVTVRFQPTAAGAFSGTLQITHPLTNQPSPTDVSLSGTSVVGTVNISVTPASIDFGSVVSDQTFDQTVTITNQATSTGTLTGSVGSLTAPFSVVSGGGAFSLIPGQSKPVTVRFSPTAVGTFSGTLQITHLATNQTSPASVSLSGKGVAAIINLNYSPGTANFGNVAIGTTSDQTITITNQATSTGTLTGNVGSLTPPFSVVSGGGAFSLTPGQSMAVTVRFSPTAATASSGTLSITHNATNKNSPAIVHLSGTGIVGTINISITPASINFGNVLVGTTSDQTVTISNQASSTATLTGSVGTLTAPFSIVSGGGAFSLMPGQSLPVTVRFSPTAAGAFVGTLSIVHNASNQSSPTNVLLSGTGGSSGNINISVTPTSVDFGTVLPGASSDQTVTITNQASSTGTLTGSVGSLTAPFSVVSGGGAFSLASGQSKSVTLRFSPTATGAFSGNLSITHNATNQSSPTNITLSGTGVTPGPINISITPGSLNFGNVSIGTSSDQTVTITNPSGSTGTLAGSVGALSAPFSVVSRGGAFSLTPGQSKPVTVRFSPVGTGTSSATLSITHNATNQSSPANVPLSGTGIVGIVNLSITPMSVDFGSVILGQTSDQTITITNQATSTGTLTGNVSLLSVPFILVSGWGDFSLAPGQSMSVTVRYFPMTAGPASDNLLITHNALNLSSPFALPLSGNGVSPSTVIDILVNPSSVDFGEITVGESADQTITITNSSDSTDRLTGSLGTLSAPFSVATGEGAFNLSPGQTRTVTVRFSATAEGPASSNLSITHNGTNQGNPISIPLSGAGVAPTSVAISFISGPSTAKLGDRVFIQNTLTNYGTPPVNNVTVNFYLSADTNIDVADMLIGKRSVTNLAPGASAGPVSTRVTIPRNVAPGSYFIGAIVRGHPNFDPKGITICLPLSKSTLLSPKNRGTNISTTPTLDWSDVDGAVSYEAQVATDSKFTNVVASAAGLTNTQWDVEPALSGETTYFWRVRGVNDCGPGPWSLTWRFKML